MRATLATPVPEAVPRNVFTARQGLLIQAPVEEVWAYVGDSGNAKQWSVFFEHITPLPGPPDGQEGSRRRCFRRPDESGFRWDEELLTVEPHRSRLIRVYGVAGSRFAARHAGEYQTSQSYEELGPGRTRLTFAAWLDRPRTAALRLLFWLMQWELRRVFRLNLENIRAAVERQGPCPHPWERHHFLG